MKIPLRYQITEYDCGPTSVLNGLSFLFEREEIPPEVVRNIMLYCLDGFGADGFPGKSGTSYTAMTFLSHWLNGFGETGRLSISSSYLSGAEVHFGPTSRLRDALREGGAAVVRLDLDGWHYVLLTGIGDNEEVYLFDPYLPDGPLPEDVRIVEDHPTEYNRIVPAGIMVLEEKRPYAFGPVGTREAVLLFNARTAQTADNTVEYII